MGILARITGRNYPGSIIHKRTTPVVDSPRYFTDEETEALRAIASQLERESKNAIAAYTALESIDKSDTATYAAHLKYLGVLAENEQTRMDAHNRYLQGTRQRKVKANGQRLTDLMNRLREVR